MLHAIKPQSEQGAAIVELLMTIPVLMLFVFAILDFSIYIKTMSTMDTAATVAVRWIQERPQQVLEQAGGDNKTWIRPAKLKVDAEKSLIEYLNAAISDTDAFGAPIEEGGINVAINLGEQYTETYTHRLYDDSSILLERSNSHVSFLPFTVTIGYEISLPTPLGKAFSDSLTHTATQAGTIDMLDGATW